MGSGTVRVRLNAIFGENTISRRQGVNAHQYKERSTPMEVNKIQSAAHESEYANVVEAMRGACLVVAIAASALVFSMSTTNFFHVKETVLAVLLVPLVTLSVVGQMTMRRGLRPFLPLILFALAPTICGLVIDPPRVTALMHREQVRIAVLILFAVVAFDVMRNEARRRMVTDAFLLTAAATAALVFVQRIRLAPWLFSEFDASADPVYSVFGNSGLLGGYLAMAIPIAFHRALTTSRITTSLSVIIVITPALVLSGSRASWLAALIGTLVVFPYRAISPQRTVATGIALTAAIILTFSLFSETRSAAWPAEDFTETMRLRLWFWDGAVRMFAAHPITGVGLGNFQFWSPLYQGDALLANASHKSNELHTQYAHNEFLHVTAETGIIGIALCLWMVLRLARCRGPEWGAVIAAIVFGMFHFPMHSAPHALVILLFAAILLARRDESDANNQAAPSQNETIAKKNSPLPGERVRARGHLLHSVVAVCALLLIATDTIWDVLLPSVALREANNLFERSESPNEAYEKAINAGRFHPQAHANYANALLQQGDFHGAREQLEKTLQGQDTGDLHLALGYTALQLGENQIALNHLKAAAHRWPNNSTIQDYLSQAEP